MSREDRTRYRVELPGDVGTSVRVVAVTMLLCCVLYPLAVFAGGRVVSPRRADGSLIRDRQGVLVGSELVAQRFERPEYVWPRPSAVGYDASASGGSNLSPAGARLRSRVGGAVRALAVPGAGPVPLDLVTESGSGLDPDVTLQAALYQVTRIARARGIAEADVAGVIGSHARRPGGPLTPQPIVNVLEVNLALDLSSR